MGLKGSRSAEEATAGDPTSRSLAEAVEGAHFYSKDLYSLDPPSLLQREKLMHLNTILT